MVVHYGTRFMLTARGNVYGLHNKGNNLIEVFAVSNENRGIIMRKIRTREKSYGLRVYFFCT